MFDSKLDHNSALHAKIREKSLLIESRIEFPDPMFMILDTPHGPNAKFLKTMTGKCGKNQGKNYFSPTLGFNSKTRSQLRSACIKSERNL